MWILVSVKLTVKYNVSENVCLDALWRHSSSRAV